MALRTTVQPAVVVVGAALSIRTLCREGRAAKPNQAIPRGRFVRKVVDNGNGQCEQFVHL